MIKNITIKINIKKIIFILIELTLHQKTPVTFEDIMKTLQKVLSMSRKRPARTNLYMS